MAMPHEPNGEWSAPEPDVNSSPRPPRRAVSWSRPTRWAVGSLAAVGLTAGLAVGGAALAHAGAGVPAPSVAAVSATPSPTATPRDEREHGPGHWFGHMAGALHGQLVVPKSGGGYETVDVQRGEVTSVSDDALTVRSKDGFTKTYVVNADTLVNGGRDGIGSVAKSDEVAVAASGGGAKPTAVRVVDLTALDDAHERWGFWKWRD